VKILRVLVPLDGSPLAEAILPFVLGLGRGPDEMAVTLLRVLPEPPLLRSESDEEHARRAAAGADLARLAARLKEKGVKEVSTLIRNGPTTDEVVKAADSENAGLIALTTHGKGGFARLVLGGTAERVIRVSPVSVLTLRAAAPLPDLDPRPVFERVLIPYDGSEISWRAVEDIVRYARPHARPKVTLFEVVETWGGPRTAPPASASASAPASASPAPGAPRDLAAEYLRLRCGGTRQDLERAVARARDLGLDADCDIDVGGPAEKILDRAVAMKASLIAMATHGRSGFTRWALGSVTEHVLEASPVPLLVCR
jgi:nucleotide-binding universal stress UspA family protein